MKLLLTIPLMLSSLWTPAIAFVAIPGQFGIQPRLEISVLTQSQDEYVIFMLAMQRFQQAAETRTDSYFQISGIHGSPHTYWDNNPRVQPGVAQSSYGYCFHGTEQFYLWHRPYLALFEQLIINNAKDIANSFRDPWLKALYTTAAGRLRIPYWDWAADSNVPRQLTDPTVTVDDPVSGQKRNIPNPLLAYTIRTPNAVPGLTRTTRGANYRQDMRNVGNELRQNVAIMFNTPGTCWNEFATYAENEHAQCGADVLFNSLEGIHNTVHNTIGGTMFFLDLAAFDSIFWLHHVNVDRLGMLWQALNPGTFVTRTLSSMGNYVQPPSTWVDENTPLWPFHRDQNNWWTAAACRNVQTLGYTYVELEGGNNGVQARVNALYGTGRTLQRFATRKRKRSFGPLHKRVVSSSDLKRGKEETTLSPSPLEKHLGSLISPNGTFSDYGARITLNKAAFPSTFTVHIFIGEIPSSATEIMSSPNHVGGFSVLKSPGMGGHMVTGVVLLTNTLLNEIVTGIIKDLNPLTVKSYCDKNLQWKIVGADGKDYSDAAGRAGLKIQVFRTEVTPDGGQDVAPTVSPPETVLNVNCAKQHPKI